MYCALPGLNFIYVYIFIILNNTLLNIYLIFQVIGIVMRNMLGGGNGHFFLLTAMLNCGCYEDLAHTCH